MATQVKTENVSINRHQSAHEYLKLVLIIAQVIGLFPVQGVLEKDVRLLEFRWNSIRVFYCGLNMAAIGFQACAYIFYVGYTGIQFFGIVSIAFFGLSFAICVVFFKLAREWPVLMQEWEISEYPVVRMFGKSTFLHRRLALTILVVTTLAVGKIGKTHEQYAAYTGKSTNRMCLNNDKNVSPCITIDFKNRLPSQKSYLRNDYCEKQFID